MEKTFLANQVAIVTGGSRGLGRAIAIELAVRGASVVVNYRSNEAAAAETVAAIRANSGVALSLKADISDEKQVKSLVASVIERFGRIDILICNAGLIRDRLVAAMTLEEWDLVMQTNLRGAFLCIRETVPHMMRQRSGSIVNLGSISGESGGRGQSNYAVSKAGIAALTRSLAIELAPKGIRVNAVAPGLIETDMTEPIRGRMGDRLLAEIPLGRYGEPADVARAVGFLASPEAAYITGAVLPVSGGLGL